MIQFLNLLRSILSGKNFLFGASMPQFFNNEKGSASTVELTLILPSLIIMLVSTFDFVWISLHELSAQFVATATVRDINVNGFAAGTGPIIARARSFLLDIDDDQIEICSDVTVTSSVDPHADLCPSGGNPGKNAGSGLSLVVVRIRPIVNTIFLHAFFQAFNKDFQPEGIAIGRNEPS